MSRAILITGATGKQGGAVVDALLALNDSNITILAVTRNPESSSARKLAEKGVNLVRGDLDDTKSLFESAMKVCKGEIWGVFSVSIFNGKKGDAEKEERQGKALVDAAIENKVKHYVITSAARGSNTYENETKVPHFASKYRVEHYLVEKSKGKMDHTILWPTAFMENIDGGFIGKIISTFWRVSMSPTAKMQLVSVKDIGYFGAQALLHPAEYANRSIYLAGDELTWNEANQIFQKVTGNPIPKTFDVFGHTMLWIMNDFKEMFKLIEQGSGANVGELKKEYPGLLSFEEWLRTESSWAQHK